MMVFEDVFKILETHFRPVLKAVFHFAQFGSSRKAHVGALWLPGQFDQGLNWVLSTCALPDEPQPGCDHGSVCRLLCAPVDVISGGDREPPRRQSPLRLGRDVAVWRDPFSTRLRNAVG